MKRPQSYNKKWTLEKCKKDALNYKGRKEWQSKSACAYTAAHSYGWLDECCKHMISTIKPMRYWNKERCINEALKYNTKTEWFKKARSSYSSALRNGWLDECCKHMLVTTNNFWRNRVSKRVLTVP